MCFKRMSKYRVSLFFFVLFSPALLSSLLCVQIYPSETNGGGASFPSTPSTPVRSPQAISGVCVCVCVCVCVHVRISVFVLLVHVRISVFVLLVHVRISVFVLLVHVRKSVFVLLVHVREFQKMKLTT